MQEKNIIEKFKVLVADDDESTAIKIKEILETNGFKDVTSKTQISALRELNGYEIIILDIIWAEDKMPKYQRSAYFGIEAARYLRESSSHSKIILMSKYFYELEKLKEIIEVCDDFFNSTGDSVKIFRTVSKIASTFEINYHQSRETFLRGLSLTKNILTEVEGNAENKPSWIGISNQIHAELLQEINFISAYYRDESLNIFSLQDSINRISASLLESTDTISKSFLELLKEIRTMANDPKVQQNFNAPVEVVAGNIEKDMIINPKPKTPAEAAKEIQDLLSFLKKTSPTNIETALEKEIRTNPTFKARLRNALKEAGLETVKVIFAPLGIGIEAVRGWLEAE